MEGFEPKNFTYEDSILPPKEQEELNALRLKLRSEDLIGDERQRYLELSEKEEKIKNPEKFSNLKQEITDEERLELIELQKRQAGSTNWTENDRLRLVELQNNRISQDKGKERKVA